MVEIVNAKSDNFPEVFELLVKLYDANTLKFEKAKNLFELELKHEMTFQLVAISNSKIVGFASSTSRIDYQEQGLISSLTCLIVDDESRGKGIGKKLLNSIEMLCKKNNSLELQFSSTFKRIKAHEFYGSQGYSKTAYYFWKRL